MIESIFLKKNRPIYSQIRYSSTKYVLMRMSESNSVFYLLSTFSQTEFMKKLLQKSEFCGVDDVHDLNTIRYLVLRDNACLLQNVSSGHTEKTQNHNRISWRSRILDSWTHCCIYLSAWKIFVEKLATFIYLVLWYWCIIYISST